LIGSADDSVGMTEFTVNTDERLSVVDITDRVAEALPDDASGTATIFVQHTTAGIAVNEAEPRLLGDFETALDGLVPDDGWAHDEIDDNADAHVRALLVGASESVPVDGGSLALGTWQSVLLVECDGPRTRTVRVECSHTNE
jgi:secondary thiamine-phosphate synthase enzyme